MSIDKLMEMSLANTIDKRMQIFIYDLICLNEYTEDDIQSIKSYEDPYDRDKHQVIDEMIKSCKLFKAKYVLLKKELPAPEEIVINITRVPGQINPKVVLTAVDSTSSIDTTGLNDSVDTLDNI